MPVEIHELVIKVTVTPPERDEARSRTQQRDDEREELVAEAVEQVLRILERRQER